MFLMPGEELLFIAVQGQLSSSGDGRVSGSCLWTVEQCHSVDTAGLQLYLQIVLSKNVKKIVKNNLQEPKVASSNHLLKPKDS